MRTSNIVQTAIPVDEALVQERPISVKVLTIGTKQVTQSLYNQLVEENVICEKTGQLKGKIWGWVNLHESGGCIIPNDKHLHAIWERDGELRRSRVFPPGAKPYPRYYLSKGYLDELTKRIHNAENTGDHELEVYYRSKLEKLRVNWEQSYQAIKETGQLFVAVSGVWK